MKALFIVFSPPTGSFGSLTRILALAKGFEKRGGSAAFCASGYVEEAIRAKGFQTFMMPESTMFGLPRPLSALMKSRSQSVQIPVKEGKSIGSVWFVYALSGMLKRKYLRSLVAAQMAAIKEYGPDVTVTEMDTGAYISAMVSGAPLVTTFASISSHGRGTFFWKLAKRTLNHVLSGFGAKAAIDPEGLMERPSVLRLIPSIPELDGTDPQARNTLYVGNLLEPIVDDNGKFAFDEGKRYVFVYLGTGSVSIERAKAVLPVAFIPYPDVVVYVAAQSIAAPYAVGNVRFVPYVSAERLLTRCDMVVCHGGLNTVTQSVEFGVPLLVFPGPIFERRFNATMVAKNGAGAMGEISDFNVEWIRARYDGRVEYRQGVEALRVRFAEYTGVEGALDGIDAWLKTIPAKDG